jgi:hypothetical protein
MAAGQVAEGKIRRERRSTQHQQPRIKTSRQNNQVS